MSERIMVAAFLERPSEGQEFVSLPAHLTYISWFNLPEEERSAFYEHMEETAAINRAPKVMGGSRQLFTDSTTGEDQLVRRLDIATSGFHLINDFAPHAEILGFVKHVDPEFDDTYFGMNWSPHVSDVPGRSFEQGEEVRLDNLTALRRDYAIGRKVVDTVFEWGSHD